MIKYWRRGEAIDYVNTSTDVINAMDVVDLKGRIGIAGRPIAPGEMGTVHVIGVFEFSKPNGTAFALGDGVSVDPATGEAVTSGGVPAGWAIEPAAAGAESVKVKIG